LHAEAGCDILFFRKDSFRLGVLFGGQQKPADFRQEIRLIL
jgi:hypothetical protein